MRLPIQYAMAHPRRLSAPAERLDLAAVGQLTFANVDRAKYPCLELAYQAGRQGGTYPTVLNAANEEAVTAFLAGEIPFSGIVRTVERALDAFDGGGDTLEDILAADRWAREYVGAKSGKLGAK